MILLYLAKVPTWIVNVTDQNHDSADPRALNLKMKFAEATHSPSFEVSIDPVYGNSC